CQDLHDPRAAETRLAAAHPRAGPPFDPVQAAGPGHPVDGVEDLALGDALAPADDLSVGGVLPDQGGPLFQREGLGVQDTLADGIEVGFRFQVQAAGRDAGHHGPDGRRAGQAGGLDGGAVHKAGGRLPDEEVVPGLVGPQARKAGDGLPQGQVLDRQPGLGADLLQAGGGGGGGLFVLDVDAGGPHQQVAVDGGGDQDPLAGRPRQLEDGVADMVPGGVVQQEVVPAPGDDLHGVAGGGHVVQLLGVDAGGVGDQPG